MKLSMKIQIIFFLLYIICFNNKETIAQTNITAGSQSGTWTLAGSPYIVMVNVTVPANQTLIIEPGVHVKFQQTYQMDIFGSLYSKGTEMAPITFEASDTAGWYNDIITAGGWHGIHFNQFQGTNDVSAFSNCIVKDVKHGVAANWNGIEAMFVYRTLKIDSCQFFHNQSSFNMAEGVTILVQGGGSFEMSYCDIHDNLNRVCALRLGTGTYEPINIHHCHFYNNSVGAAIWMLQSNVLFEYNEVNDNKSIYDMSAIRITGFHATLRHNSIHHNVSENEAPITGFAGIIDIDANLICNNHHTSGNCGLVDGGGGIHAMQNDGSNWDSTRYKIRNNIIANNYSPFFGGGIYVYNTIVKVMNNHFINNGAHFGGPGIYGMGTNTEVYMQNNLFYGNCSDPAGDTHDIRFSDVHLITYKNNWAEFDFNSNVDLGGSTGIIISGDTSDNVVGADPLMINPTLNCSYTDSALNSNFNLQVGSDCIDAGDSTGSLHTAKDYLGNYRMMGSSIDIGAFEQLGEIINSAAFLSENELVIYPNPNDGNFKFCNKNSEPAIFKIFDTAGKLVFEKPFTNYTGYQLIESDLASGIYLLQLVKSNEIVKQKLIVQ